MIIISSFVFFSVYCVEISPQYVVQTEKINVMKNNDAS